MPTPPQSPSSPLRPAAGGPQQGNPVTAVALPEVRPNHKLTVEEVLDGLVTDGLVARSTAQNLLKSVAPKDRAERHALEIVADAKLHYAPQGSGSPGKRQEPDRDAPQGSGSPERGRSRAGTPRPSSGSSPWRS